MIFCSKSLRNILIDLGKDRLYQDTSAKHILVMRNGHFYTFDVLDNNGQILPPDVYLARVKAVLDDTNGAKMAEVPLGILTTENRDVWAEARRHMCNHHENENSLRMIDSALFNIVLDDEVVGSDPLTVVRHYLHGTGKNRYVQYCPLQRVVRKLHFF